MHELTSEELVERARRVARERGSPVLSKKDFTRITGIRDSTIYRLFPDDGWIEVIQRAGLGSHRADLLGKVPTREDIVDAAKRAAAESGTTVLSKKTFARLTGISTGQIYKRFPDGGWRKVLELAGLENHPRDMAARPKVTREGIVEAAKRAATESASTVLSKKQFTLRTGIGHRSIDNLFPDGGWHKVQELAGLGRHPSDADRRSDEEILAEIHRVVTSVGHFPNRWVFSDRATFSSRTLDHRFGGMKGAQSRYRAWLAERERGSPPPSRPPGLPEGNPPSSPPRVPADARPTRTYPQRPETGFEHGHKAAVRFGHPLDFRGLRHAPVNEQGVVLLFGMVAHELGFLVEAVRTGYPDCRAKRLDPEGYYNEVDIEFEFKSSNFQEHGHDPAACDVIVCWEHNWRDCPLSLKVVELRSEIKRLDQPRDSSSLRSSE